MKKIVSLILAALLLLATSALAEDIDLSQMSIDDLILLRSRVNTEINERMAGSDTVFLPFDYKVGTHIPAGIYMITCTEFVNGQDEGRAAAWAEGESSWGCHTILYLDMIGEFGIIELAEGDTLRIVDCTVTIRPYILPTI